MSRGEKLVTALGAVVILALALLLATQEGERERRRSTPDAQDAGPPDAGPPPERLSDFERLRRQRYTPRELPEAARAARDTLRGELVAAGFERWADDLVAASLDAVVTAGELVQDVSLEEPVSKVGGRPDLPDHVPWPEHGRRPLAFLAQIRLGEVGEADREGALPDEGMLSFFYDADEEPWGFDPDDHGNFAVLHTPSVEGLSRRLPPRPRPGDDRARRLRFGARVVPPDRLPESPDLTEATRRAYDTWWRARVGPPGQDHRLLGHPGALKDPYMGATAELVTHGFYAGGRLDEDDPRLLAQLEEAGRWRLLLQVDSDPELGLSWAGGGRLYYWIPGDDLRQRDFEGAWVILQTR